MKILLLGANGQVGHELRRSLAALGEIVATTRSGTLPDGVACEIADFDRPETLAPLIERVAPDLVVNAAAYTAVDRAEDDRDAAFRANAQAPALLAEACASRGLKLIHYSTDYVFDGSAGRPYREEDATAPLGVYGASKLAGEEAIRASGADHLILRTAWVYGVRGSNFLLTMLRLGKDRDELRVVADQHGTPTSAALIADITALLAARHPQASGVLHLTAAGATSWCGFAQAIMTAAHERKLLPHAVRVTPIETRDYPTRARRPAYSCLDTQRLRSFAGVELPAWPEALERVLDHIPG